jgi:hypothetical protein
LHKNFKATANKEWYVCVIVFFFFFSIPYKKYKGVQI